MEVTTESLAAGSELPGEIFKIAICDPCQKQATNKVPDAEWYCQECEEFVCTDCKLQHKKFKSLKNHNLVNIHPQCQPCQKKRSNIKSNFFCSDCQLFLCEDCRAHHGLLPITKNHHIVSSQDRVKGKNVPSTHRDTHQTGKNQIQRHSTSHSQIIGHNTPDKQNKRFLIRRRSKVMGYNTAVVQPAVSSNTGDIKYCTANKQGIETSGGSNSMQQYQVHEQKQVNIPFSQCTAKSVTEFDMTVPGDTQKASTKGSAFLPDSRLLLVDYWNKKLKLFDVNYKFVTHKQFSDWPCEISVHDSSEVAVTVRDRAIVRLSVDGDVIKEKGKISPGFRCWAASYISSDKLVVTGMDMDRDGAILCVFTTAGRQLSRLRLGKRCIPWHVTVDREKSRAYVSTAYFSTVYAIDLDTSHTVLTCMNTNKIVFSYKHKHLMEPEGVTLDKDHNLYVCGKVSQNIHEVSPEGEHIKILLSHEDGLYQPHTMSFTPTTYNVIYTQW